VTSAVAVAVEVDARAGAAADTRREDLARRNALAVLATVTVCSMAAWFSATAVLPGLRADLGLSTAAARMLVVAVQLGFVTGGLVSASAGAADRVPARRLVLCGASVAALANALPVVAANGAVLTFARFAVGFSLAFVFPAGIKTMATWYRAGRGRALATLVAALTVGSASPHLVNASGVMHWRTLLLATSGLCLAGGALGAVAIRNGPYAVPARGRFDVRVVPAVMRARGVRLASAGYFGHMWELYAGWAAAGTLMTEVFPRSPRGASLATFAVLAVGAAGCWYGAALGERRGGATSARIALVWSASLMALLAIAAQHPSPFVVVLFAAWSFWAIADSAQLTTLVTEHADAERIGTALTVQLAVGFGLTSVTMWSVPAVESAFGWTAAFALLVPGPVLGALAARRLERSAQRS
jgi:predicted MFS family arabinose efflux permease